MNLEAATKNRILSVINIFETGTPEGKYDAISIYADGKKDANGKKTRQITYGRSQTTEQGNLRELIADYIKNKGIFAKHFEYYLPKIGVESLVDNAMFKEVLVDAAKGDPIMKTTQDAFFDRKYYQPAIKFASENGFTLPLSALVIYDSYIHSSKVPQTVRNMFPERVPKDGGNEKSWVKAYIDARRKWLLRLPDPVPLTVYRMDCFKAQINADNWMLQKQVLSNGAVSRDAGSIGMASLESFFPNKIENEDLQNTQNENVIAKWEGYTIIDAHVETTPKMRALLKMRKAVEIK
jgi:chitosanase